MNAAPQLFAGLMTGNSMDAADAVLLSFADEKPKVIRAARKKMPAKLAARMRALAECGGKAAEFMRAQNELTKLCAAAFAALGAKPGAVAAIGCHGQTICHNPARGFSWQILNGALLAELCGCSVVCDFRSRDIVAGGQGAPLAPFFHRAVFPAPCAVLNIGGIANITLLEKNGAAAAFDIGPGNILLDDWCKKNGRGAFDKNGEWAKGGAVIPRLLARLLRRAFFAKPPPKSCGREEFAPALFYKYFSGCAPRDVQRTLLELTAQTAAAACAGTPALFLCGGGARNLFLARRIAELAKTETKLSDEIGIPAEEVEAAAFAWLARAHLRGEKQNAKTITGAPPRVPGAHYPK